MNFVLALAVLKTLPEPWIETGVKLSSKYAEQLMANGLIEHTEDGGYHLSEKGYLYLIRPDRRNALFTPGTSEQIEKYCCAKF